MKKFSDVLKLLHPSEKSLLGIDITSTSVKLLEINSTGNSLTIEGFGTAFMPEDAMDGPAIKSVDAVAAQIRSCILEQKLSATKAVIAVPDSLAISRTIQVHEGMTDDEIEELVVIEADKYIPYPIEEINLDFSVIGPSAKNTTMQEVLIVASRTEHVGSRVEAVSLAGLTPEIVEVESYAVERVARMMAQSDLNSTERQLVAIIDIGAVYTYFYILLGNKIIFTREEEFGGTQLIQSIMQKYGKSFDEATRAFLEGQLPEGFESDIIEPYIELILLQVKRGLQFFFSSTSYTSIDRIYLAGGVAKLPNLAEKVEAHINIKTEIANPMSHLALSSKIDRKRINDEAPILLVACGLALRGHFET